MFFKQGYVGGISKLRRTSQAVDLNLLHSGTGVTPWRFIIRVRKARKSRMCEIEFLRSEDLVFGSLLLRLDILQEVRSQYVVLHSYPTCGRFPYEYTCVCVCVNPAPVRYSRRIYAEFD